MSQNVVKCRDQSTKVQNEPTAPAPGARGDEHAYTSLSGNALRPARTSAAVGRQSRGAVRGGGAGAGNRSAARLFDPSEAAQCAACRADGQGPAGAEE